MIANDRTDETNKARRFPNDRKFCQFCQFCLMSLPARNGHCPMHEMRHCGFLKADVYFFSGITPIHFFRAIINFEFLSIVKTCAGRSFP